MKLMLARVLNNIATLLYSIYIIGFVIMLPYYNWQFARDNGFIAWLLLGEIAPTGKAIAWPYFVAKSGHLNNRGSTTPQRQQNASSPSTSALTICTPFSMYRSNGRDEIRVETPDRYNHILDANFQVMGYQVVPCVKAGIVLQIAMYAQETPSGERNGTVRIVGTGNGRTGSAQIDFTASDMNSDDVLGRIGFSVVKVMDILEPGFQTRYDNTIRRE